MCSIGFNIISVKQFGQYFIKSSFNCKKYHENIYFNEQPNKLSNG